MLFCLSLLCPIGAPSYTERRKDDASDIVCSRSCDRRYLRWLPASSSLFPETNFVCVVVLFVQSVPMISFLVRHAGPVVVLLECKLPCLVSAESDRAHDGAAQVRLACLGDRRKTTSFSAKAAKHASLFRLVIVGDSDGSPDRPFVGRRGRHIRPWVSENAVE